MQKIKKSYRSLHYMDEIKRRGFIFISVLSEHILFFILMNSHRSTSNISE